MGVYVNLIYKNWSYHATKTTEVKKSWLEKKLIVCNLHAILIPLLGTVGLFPTLSGVGVIPQLQICKYSYTKENLTKKVILKHTCENFSSVLIHCLIRYFSIPTLDINERYDDYMNNVKKEFKKTTRT